MTTQDIKTGTRIVLLRTGPMFSEDPVEELNSLLKTNDLVAFAKFGKPLGKNFIERLFQFGPDTYLAVYRSRVDRDFAHLYPISSVSTTLPSGVPFPKYYIKNRAFVSAWVVVKADPPVKIVSLENLIVASSRNRAKTALGTSMSSHYLCSYQSSE